MKLGCIVLAYNLPGQLAQLLEAMTHPNVRLYVHIDKAKPIEPFTDALAGADVAFLPRHASVWGSAECVDAALDGMSAALRDGCDYLILISGQDYPLRPVGEIVEFFEAAPDRSYLKQTPIAQTPHRYHGRDRTDFYTYTVRGQRETCIPRGEDASYFGLKGSALNAALRLWSLPRGRRQFPAYAQPFTGHTWWNMSRSAAEYVMAFLAEHPDYRRYHQHTRIPEEIFFTSILAGTDYPGEVVDDSLRFLRWGQPLSPLTLTAEDVPEMLSSGKLFARKFAGVPDEMLALSGSLSGPG